MPLSDVKKMARKFENELSNFHVLTTLFQSTYFTNFTSNGPLNITSLEQ